MDTFKLRLIEPNDNSPLQNIIKTVLKEHGADRPGFAFVDPELDDMHLSYTLARHAYFVVENIMSGELVGGAGFGPLTGEVDSICELRKMYLSSTARGHGLGVKLLDVLLKKARNSDYTACYLETLESMSIANALYQRFGFEKLNAPLGNTGHDGCNVWYIKKI